MDINNNTTTITSLSTDASNDSNNSGKRGADDQGDQVAKKPHLEVQTPSGMPLSLVLSCSFIKD